MFEDTKEVIKSRKSKKERQHNDRKKNEPKDLQNTMQKTKEQNEPHWKTERELRYGNRVEHHDT